MKIRYKFFTAAITCAFILQPASAYELTSSNSIYDKVSELNADNYRIFTGYDFLKFDTEDHSIGLAEIVNSEIDYVIRKPSKSYVVHVVRLPCR